LLPTAARRGWTDMADCRNKQTKFRGENSRSSNNMIAIGQVLGKKVGRKKGYRNNSKEITYVMRRAVFRLDCPTCFYFACIGNDS
jgi:hypothetical protein